MENEHDNSPSDEERRTLWVGGIDSRVDEELLYELMLNVRFYFSIICNYINAKMYHMLLHRVHLY